MTERSAGMAGLTAVAVFWPALFAFAAAHPGYSHFTNAISELGAIGAPQTASNKPVTMNPTMFQARACGAPIAPSSLIAFVK